MKRPLSLLINAAWLICFGEFFFSFSFFYQSGQCIDLLESLKMFKINFNKNRIVRSRCFSRCFTKRACVLLCFFLSTSCQTQKIDMLPVVHSWSNGNHWSLHGCALCVRAFTNREWITDRINFTYHLRECVVLHFLLLRCLSSFILAQQMSSINLLEWD